MPKGENIEYYSICSYEMQMDTIIEQSESVS